MKVQRIIELNTFTLEEYSEYKIQHNEVLRKLALDESCKKYLGDITFSINQIKKRQEEDFYSHDCAYIVYKSDTPIGYFSMTRNEIDYELSCGILPEFRNGNLASMLLQQFTYEIFDIYPDIDKLKLKIEADNIRSRKVAEFVGYEKEGITTYTSKRK